MAALLQSLIDKRDTREVIRDQVAAILIEESTQQVVYASAGGRDPELWRLRVYDERAEPWAAFSDEPGRRTPVVNVWIETTTFDKSGSDLTKHSKASSTIHVDCYGFGVSESTPTGHTSADRTAVLEAERTARLCRNVLMSSYYRYLGFPRGTDQVVWDRWVGSMTSFQPSLGEQPVERIAAIRMDLEVTHSEWSPQYEPETLEVLALTLKRTDEGEWLSSQYDLTAP